MGTLLTVLAVILLLVGVAAVGMAARLSAGEGTGPAVAERQRRLRFRLATPAVLLAVVLFAVSRFL